MEVESGKYLVNFMTNHPLTLELCHRGDVIEVPVMMAEPLVRDTVLAPMPDETPVSRGPRHEPSKIIGVNITEAEYAALAKAREELSPVAPPPPGELPEPINLPKSRGKRDAAE